MNALAIHACFCLAPTHHSTTCNKDTFVETRIHTMEAKMKSNVNEELMSYQFILKKSNPPNTHKWKELKRMWNSWRWGVDLAGSCGELSEKTVRQSGSTVLPDPIKYSEYLIGYRTTQSNEPSEIGFSTLFWAWHVTSACYTGRRAFAAFAVCPGVSLVIWILYSEYIM